MTDGFSLAMRRLKFIIFSVLAGFVLLVAYHLVSRGSDASLWLLFLSLWLLFEAYLYLSLLGRLRSRTRFLVRLVPVIVVCGLVASLILVGLVTALVHEGVGEFFDGPSWDSFYVAGEEVSFSPYQAVALFWFLVAVVAGLLLASLVSLRSLLRMRSFSHHVDAGGVRFWSPHREFDVRWREYRCLVVSDAKVLACKDEYEEHDALDYVNRPYASSLSAPLLDGVLYLDTDRLLEDAQRKGFEVCEEGLAVVIRPSS